jgi:hypothetical protein
MPVGPKPIVIPDSFPSSANRTEAYRIEIHNWSNTLNYDSSTSTASGEVAMSVYVYDWFNAGKNLVCAYPQSDALLGTCNPFPTGGDSTYSSYSFELWPMNMKSADDIMVWFEVSCEEDGYQGIIPYQKEAVCFRRIVPVAGG